MPEPDAAQNVDVTSCHITVTVILCTYNRCQSLAKALQSVAASEMPSSTAWEVLVVDNNSTRSDPRGRGRLLSPAPWPFSIFI